VKRKILFGIATILIVIQFFRSERNVGQADMPTDITHAVLVPENVMHVLKTSCYDCHSNRTTYPWYTNINPVGWWMNHHVEEGKDELNFSTFTSYNKKRADHKLEEIAEQVQEHEMPLESYTWMHKDAKLDAQQIQLIVDWVKASRATLAAAPQ